MEKYYVETGFCRGYDTLHETYDEFISDENTQVFDDYDDALEYYDRIVINLENATYVYLYTYENEDYKCLHFAFCSDKEVK